MVKQKEAKEEEEGECFSHLPWVNCASRLFDVGAILVLCWSLAMAKWTEMVACCSDWRLEKVATPTVVQAFCHKAEIDAKVGLLHLLRPGQLCQEWLVEVDPLSYSHIWGSEELMLLTSGFSNTVLLWQCITHTMLDLVGLMLNNVLIFIFKKDLFLIMCICICLCKCISCVCRHS